jgi:hypothetical protein
MIKVIICHKLVPNIAVNKNVKGIKNQEYPRVPWIHWCLDSGHPRYQVIYQGCTIQCLYIRYGVYNRVPYKMDIEGVGQLQFARAIYATPKLPVEAEVEDQDLDLFV